MDPDRIAKRKKLIRLAIVLLKRRNKLISLAANLLNGNGIAAPGPASKYYYYRKAIHQFQVMRVRTSTEKTVVEDVDDNDRGLSLWPSVNGSYDHEHLTGLRCGELAEVENCVGLVMKALNAKEPSMGLRKAVHMTLNWLRRNSHYKDLAIFWKVSVGTAHGTVQRFMMYLRCAVDEIPDASEWSEVACKRVLAKQGGGLVTVVGAVDCTVCYRNRVHPGHEILYRGDVGHCSLSAQILVDFRGVVLDVAVARGRENDWSMFGFSGLRGLLRERRLAVLADSGYEQCDEAIAPESMFNKARVDTDYNEEHSFARAIIEHLNAHIQAFLAVGTTTGGFNRATSIEFQAICILVACNLHNLKRRFMPDNFVPFWERRELTLLAQVGPRVYRGRDANGNALDQGEYSHLLSENPLEARPHLQGED